MEEEEHRKAKKSELIGEVGQEQRAAGVSDINTTICKRVKKYIIIHSNQCTAVHLAVKLNCRKIKLN